MHPALLKLLRLRGRGLVRRMVRGVKTPRGAAFTAVAVVMICLWLAPNFFALRHVPRTDPAKFRAYAPLALLAMALAGVFTSAGERAINFSPGEVDFLFAGPFRRSELLLYKLTASVVAALVPALFFMVFLLRHFSWWLAGFVGIFLALLFIQLISMSVVLLGQTVAERIYTRVRRVFAALVVVILGAALVRALTQTSARDLGAALLRLPENPALHWLLLPFSVYTQAMGASSLLALAKWSALSLILIGALLVFVIRLDANYLEAALTISQRQQARVQRIRRGGAFAHWAPKSAARWHIPPLPWLAGAGPVMWRQFMHSLRSSGGLLLLMLILGTMIVPILVAARGGVGTLFVLAGVLIYGSILFQLIYPAGFRGDLDHMEWLKMLPLSHAAVALGEMMTSVVIITVFQGILIIVAAGLAHHSAAALLVILLFALPFNLLVSGVENLVFLLFPVSTANVTAGDFQSFGRQMVSFFAKIVLLLLCLAAVIGPLLLTVWLSGGFWSAGLAVAWVVLLALGVGAVRLVSWAFRRFDVSFDMPV